MYINKDNIEKIDLIEYLQNISQINTIDASYILKVINKIQEKENEIQKVTITFNENKCGIPFKEITKKISKKINIFSLIKKTKIYYIQLNTTEIIIFGKYKQNNNSISILKNIILELEKDYSRKDNVINRIRFQ
jgi:glutamate synthase domain-containing protein 1